MWYTTEDARRDAARQSARRGNIDTRLRASKMPNTGWRIIHVTSGTIVGKGASYKAAVDDARRLLGIIEDAAIKRTLAVKTGAVPGGHVGDHG